MYAVIGIVALMVLSFAAGYLVRRNNPKDPNIPLGK